MIDYKRCEDLAWNSAPVPADLNALELVYALGCYEMYAAFRSGTLKKEAAEEYKRYLRREVEEVGKKYEFAMRCWESAAERHKVMETALREYRTNPGREAADALAFACDGALSIGGTR